MQYGNEMMMGAKECSSKTSGQILLLPLQQSSSSLPRNSQVTFGQIQQLHFKQSSSSQCRAWGVTWPISDQTQQLPLLLYSRRVTFDLVPFFDQAPTNWSDAYEK